MKKTTKHCGIILAFLCLSFSSQSVFSQFTSLSTLADYPLLVDENDASGNQSAITLEDAPLNRGIYSSGIYPGGLFPNVSHANTPYITGFDFNSFRIVVRFITDEYQFAPVIMGGNSWRWMGAYLGTDSLLRMKYNNANFESTGVKYELNKWHEIVLTYDGSVGKMYFNGTEIASAPFTIVDGGDSRIGISDFAVGETFKGVIQGLKVYDAPTGGNLLADYPLHFDGVDATGTQDDMVMNNTPFIGGAYTNGIYLNNATGEVGSNVGTPTISGLNMNSFAVNFRFKAGNVQANPVLIGGHSFRWMGLILRNDTTVSLRYNNSSIVNTTTKYNLGDWHKVRMSYDGVVGKLFFDDVLILEESFTIQHGNDKNFATNNFGGGRAFMGTIMDLQIFDADTLGNLLAHYPLLTDGVDLTGNYEDLTLSNAPLIGGASPKGIYQSSGAKTPNISGFNFNRFSVSGRFSTPVAMNQPVLIGGDAYRWLGLYLLPDSTIQIKYNNSNYQICNASYIPNEWHHFTLSYDKDSQKAWVFFDFLEVCTIDFDLVEGGDNNFSTYDYANSGAFWGNIQEIKISEGSWEGADGIDDLLDPNTVEVYPNPASDSWTIQLEEEFIHKTNLSIYTLQGQKVYTKLVRNSFEQINISEWISGTYIMMVEHENGKRLSKKIVKY